MTYGELLIELLPYMKHDLIQSIPKLGYHIFIDNKRLESVVQESSRLTFRYVGSGITVYSCNNNTEFVGISKITKDIKVINGDANVYS